MKALAKIHEYQYTFLHRPYLKSEDIYVVETKAQPALSDENVQRKQRAALAWVEEINGLPAPQRLDVTWHYVLLGEATVKDWHAKKAQVADLLEFARIRRSACAEQGKLL